MSRLKQHVGYGDGLFGRSPRPTWLRGQDKPRTWGLCLDDIAAPRLWNSFQTRWDTLQCETQTSDSEGSRDYGGQRAALRGEQREEDVMNFMWKSPLHRWEELRRGWREGDESASQSCVFTFRQTQHDKHLRAPGALRRPYSLSRHENMKIFWGVDLKSVLAAPNPGP